MREIDWNVAPQTDTVVVLTTETIGHGAALKMADFKDSHVLLCKGVHLIGLNKDKGVIMAKPPMFMKNGTWYAHEDLEAQKLNENLVLDPTILEFKQI